MSKPADKRYSVAVDFDGVIHSYTSPWVNAETIPDPPVEGAIEWLNETAEKFDVVIFTTRGATTAGAAAVHIWLHRHGFRGDGLRVTAKKPPALLYIDDRAWRFEGRFPDAQEIHRALPWNKRDWIEHGPQITVAFDEVEARIVGQVLDDYVKRNSDLPQDQAQVVHRLAGRLRENAESFVEATIGLWGLEELEKRARRWLARHPEGELPGIGSGVADFDLNDDSEVKPGA